ncbi:MAG: nucleotidyltransferase family protein [Anaerolineae bacterium]|nr:nucleotidyltransferase family protein [Anaerolineae bacterium]
MDCIIAAGGTILPEDPLFPYSHGRPKALIDVAGQTMLERVAQAVGGSRHVDGVIVAGLDESVLAGLQLPLLLAVLPDAGSLVGNMKAALEWRLEQARPGDQILVSTADIPMLTAGVVDAFIDQCRPFDHLVYYNLVTRETMEARFPNSNRTFVRLRDADVAGGDLLLVQSRVVESDEALWNALADARKHAWQAARLVGLGTLLRLLTRRLTVRQVEEAATRVFSAPVRVLLSPHATLAMDADKPEQVELLRRHLTAGN